MRALSITLLTILTTVATASIATATPEFPFSVSRDANGRVERIELPQQTKLSENEPNVLDLLRLQLSAGETQQVFGSELALSKQEQKVFARARASLGQSVSLNQLSNPLLNREFISALPKLENIKVYRLLASPYQQNAFDKENITKDAVEEILDAAEKVLKGPEFQVFEFLVTETLESLESRREFHQYRLLYWLDQAPSMFTEEERNFIRSSVFYSRLGVMDFFTRRKAKSNWDTFGTDQYRSLMRKCVSGNCFYIGANVVQNLLVAKSNWSKDPSIAHDFAKPYRVRNTRITILLLKLALRFVPGPGFAKSGVRDWLDSQYVNQRRAEGMLFESARLSESNDLARWVAIGSANPLLSARGNN